MRVVEEMTSRQTLGGKGVTLACSSPNSHIHLDAHIQTLYPPVRTSYRPCGLVKVQVRSLSNAVWFCTDPICLSRPRFPPESLQFHAAPLM